ncbi:MAG: DUF2256 domain-containing protein [Planctomycetota bacterium]|nr:MAG: DUF2256 domain-containing protein [Planctomycetota bacterium]
MTRRGRGTGSERRKAGTPRPVKVCATCGREFQWRRKWAACWDLVRYCSDRCRNDRPTGNR